MITLLIFAPCEKVIIGTQDDAASIISVLETIKIKAPADLPSEVMLPLRWTVLSVWKRDANIEDSVEFEQLIEVFRSDGSSAGSGSGKFRVTKDHLMYRIIVDFPLFPIGQQGQVFVRTKIRQTNPETEWSDIAEYPLLVIHEN